MEETIVPGGRWRVPPSAPNYEVSEYGEVRRITAGKGTRVGYVLKQCPAKAGGYPSVLLSHNGKARIRTVHSLVAEAFLGPRPVGLVVCHCDGDPTNNHVSNLRYDTYAGNSADMVAHGTCLFGERVPTARLTNDEVRAIWGDPLRHVRGGSVAVAARYGVARQTIRDIWNGVSWTHITEGED